MSLARFSARNHPQQGVEDDIVDDRETDPIVFGPLERRFGFTVDVAASAANAKLPKFYTKAQNGLNQSWEGERVWCNPPFSNIRPWIEKALTSSAELVVLLLPANRTEQSWWQDLIEPFRGSRLMQVEFLPGRIRFINPGDTVIKPNSRPPFGCCLVIISPRRNRQLGLEI